MLVTIPLEVNLEMMRLKYGVGRGVNIRIRKDKLLHPCRYTIMAWESTDE